MAILAYLAVSAVAQAPSWGDGLKLGNCSHALFYHPIRRHNTQPLLQHFNYIARRKRGLAISSEPRHFLVIGIGNSTARAWKKSVKEGVIGWNLTSFTIHDSRCLLLQQDPRSSRTFILPFTSLLQSSSYTFIYSYASILDLSSIVSRFQSFSPNLSQSPNFKETD